MARAVHTLHLLYLICALVKFFARMKDPDGRHKLADKVDVSEERKGLLWEEGEDNHVTEDEIIPPSSRKSQRRRCCIASSLIGLILTAVVAPALYYWVKPSRPVADFDSQKLRSNGTHYFKKTSLIVSIDGLRCVA